MLSLKEVLVTFGEFKEKLREDPRIGESYIKNIELPLAIATDNKFLKNLIMEKSDYSPKTGITSDWFQFSQQIEKIKVDQDRLILKYDEGKETHPPLMSRKGIGP